MDLQQRRSKSMRKMKSRIRKRIRSRSKRKIITEIAGSSFSYS
jgi:hypothetical protein